MIKASVRAVNGKGLLIVGLSRKTIEVLQAGKPISIDLMGPLGKEGVVLLVAGETEEAILSEIKPLIGTVASIERSEP